VTTTYRPPSDTGDAASTPAGRLGASRLWLGRILLANLVAEVGIIVTGGLVRLTGSGLGCTTAPECTPGHFTPVHHAAKGYHSYIEFGNRTLTGVLVVLAVLAAFAVWVWAPRRALKMAALFVLVGVPVQAVIGAISVLVDLDPVVISLHFLISAAMVAASAYLYFARDEPDVRPRLVVPGILRGAGVATSAVAAVVLVLGTVVTGSGPHSGDETAPSRLGFDLRTVSWLHADVVMLFAGLAIAMWLALRVTDTPDRTRRAWTGVIHVIIVQAVVGYTQYFTGLPIGLVALHMLLAGLLIVALTRAMLTLRVRDLGALDEGTGAPSMEAPAGREAPFDRPI